MPTIPAVVQQEFEPEVALDRLTPHPANPNEGDDGLLSETLDEVGFAGAVLAQKSTGILIDGETRYRVALARGMTTLPVMWVDVDDETRDRMLAEWNETGRRGRNNEQKLIDLLVGLAGTARGLAGTAHSGDQLDDLIAGLNGPLEITDAPSDGDYSETEDEEQARRDRIDRYRDTQQGGALVEMILLYPADQHTEVAALLANWREIHGVDAKAADIILDALRAQAAQ